MGCLFGKQICLCPLKKKPRSAIVYYVSGADVSPVKYIIACMQVTS